jgi:hypothetical protein
MEIKDIHSDQRRRESVSRIIEYSNERDPNDGAMATWDPGGNSPAGEDIIIKAAC